MGREAQHVYLISVLSAVSPEDAKQPDIKLFSQSKMYHYLLGPYIDQLIIC